MHRVVYELLVGPPGPELHHICRVHRCANPAHLLPVDEAAHKAIHVNDRSHCRAGHEWTEANTYVRSNGQRMCRACKAAVTRRRYASLDDEGRAAEILARTARRRAAKTVDARAGRVPSWL